MDEATAERQGEALTVLQRLLKEQGVRARHHQRIGFTLFAERAADCWPDQPASLSSTRWYPPMLTVGWPWERQIATVTVAQRSGCYLVALGGDRDSEPLVVHEAAQVVALVMDPELRVSA
ncbi:hypothetical protein ACFY19_22270 [Streptosporangium saharense]|uniref:hypothetical protein n=1 Tax=Streptosporangium saharense TaxID=1706840 RepID=UPI00367A8F27